MSNGGQLLPLSSSQGGEAILLDISTVPGKAVHANPSDSGGNDLITDMLVGNPNPNQVSIWVGHQGPGLPVPTKQEDMIRIDVPPTQEGAEVRLFYTPFLVAPGYTYHISCSIPPGANAPYLYGYVGRYTAGASPSGFIGYGGLGASTQQALGTITAGTWITVPFQYGTLSIPQNITQDPGNNRVAILAPGIWAITSYATIEFTKTNTDRIIYMRFWNETKGVEISDAPFPQYVEQNNTGGSWAVPAIPADVATASVGDFMRVEIGGAAEDFNGINLDKAGLNLFKIG